MSGDGDFILQISTMKLKRSVSTKKATHTYTFLHISFLLTLSPTDLQNILNEVEVSFTNNNIGTTCFYDGYTNGMRIAFDSPRALRR